jgi:predicted kinase
VRLARLQVVGVLERRAAGAELDDRLVVAAQLGALVVGEGALARPLLELLQAGEEIHGEVVRVDGVDHEGRPPLVGFDCSRSLVPAMPPWWHPAVTRRDVVAIVLRCPSMRDVRLLLTCGLPGAGKTTLATQLAADRPAVRLTKDDWQRALGSSPWDRVLGDRIERELWRLAQELLQLGTSVVLDFGLWARSERDELRTAARVLGVGVELHVLDVPIDELWRRIDARNATPPWDAEPISRAHLDEWAAIFEPPDADELARFDPPPAGDD